jgi:hypothetical protein
VVTVARYRQDQLPGTEYQPSMFDADDRDLLDAIAAQATEADRDATADLLSMARAKP